MQYVIGIDEVGRGALAGPVTVVAVATTAKTKFQLPNSKSKLRDSKKLTARQRELWFSFFKNHPALCYSIARVYPRRIEQLNIARAANLAALRAYQKLIAHNVLPITRHKVFLDGGLYLGDAGQSRQLGARTMVRGDQKYTAIKIASIIAKVSRDRFMKRISSEYSQYGFETHKGYGTKAHFAAIRRYGPSSAHRLTFLS